MRTVTTRFGLIAPLLLALIFPALSSAAGNQGRINVDVDCRCPDMVGQSFCADFKKKVAESAAYKLVDNTSGYGLGVHFACVDIWKGLSANFSEKMHMSAISVAFTIYADTLPGELLEDSSVFRVGIDAVPDMSQQVVSALGQIVTANSGVFDHLRAAEETSGASAGGMENSSPEPAASPSADATPENLTP